MKITRYVASLGFGVIIQGFRVHRTQCLSMVWDIRAHLDVIWLCGGGSGGALHEGGFRQQQLHKGEQLVRRRLYQIVHSSLRQGCKPLSAYVVCSCCPPELQCGIMLTQRRVAWSTPGHVRSIEFPKFNGPLRGCPDISPPQRYTHLSV